MQLLKNLKSKSEKDQYAILGIRGLKCKNKIKLNLKLVKLTKRKVKQIKLTKRTKMNQWPK
jgi:hypothetical protein